MFMSGHLRSLYTLAAEFMRSQFDGDVFVATWDREDCKSDSPLVDHDKARKALNATTLEICPFDTVLANAHRKTRYFDKYRHFQATCHKGRQGHDSFCMFHVMKRAWMLLEDHAKQKGFTYDVIVRFRPDYVFRGLPPNFTPAKNTLYFPNNTNFQEITDNLFVADQETMSKMMVLPDLVDTYLLREETTWCHEHLVDHHVNVFGLTRSKIQSLDFQNADGTPPGGDQITAMRWENKDMIVATMVVRNEEDIIAECIRHNLSAGVNRIIMTLNNSEDATRDIAATFPEVTIIDEPSNEYQPGVWQTRMARMAFDIGAAWVVPIDADELWTGIANLLRVPGEYGIVLAKCLFNHPPTTLIKEPFSCTQMPVFEKDTARSFGEWGSGRFAFRPYPDVEVAMGNDRLENHGQKIATMRELWVHHYPMRNFERYCKKVELGTEALMRGHSDWSVGLAWRVAYKKLKDGTLFNEYEHKLVRINNSSHVQS